MKDWFEKLAIQYIKVDYGFDYSRELRPYNKIKHFSIDDNVISADVEHDKYEYNSINIRFKKFSAIEKEKLTEIIENNPINQLKIINNTIPDELFNLGIDILPSSLDELDIECTFKNKNDNIIDTLSILKFFNRRLKDNKFEIFKIKNLNLKKQNIKYPIKNINDLFDYDYKSYSSKNSLTDLHKINNILLYDIKYPSKTFKFIYDELFELLNNEIDTFPFEINNNKKLMTFDNSKDTTYIKSQEKKKTYIMKKWDVKNEFAIDINEMYEPSEITKKDLFNFINEISQVEFDDIEYLNYFKDILNLTYKLVGYNAIMPEIFILSDNTGHIRWIPSFFDDAVSNLCETYYLRCPENLITFNGNNISKKDQSIILISFIMDGLIEYVTDKHNITSFAQDISQVIFDAFTAKSMNKKQVKMKNIESINKKLLPFYLKTLKFNYILSMNKDLEIEFKIKKDNISKNLADGSYDELKYLKIIYDFFTQFKIENNTYEKIQLNDKEFIIFWNNIKPVMEYINVELDIPFKVVESEIKLVLDTDLNEDNFSFNRLDEINWNVELNDRQIEINEFDKITNHDASLIKTEDTYYITEWRDYYKIKRNTFHFKYGFKKHKILQLALLEKYFDIEFEVTSKLKKLINATNIYESPKSLTGKLRPYQKIGYSWLVQNIKTGFGSILADDMGLGKTIQVLSAILYLKQTKNLEYQSVLIVVPPTLLANWENELKKFAPDLTYYIYHGSKREFPLEKYDIILTSYSIVRLDLELFNTEEWMLCIIDEAQNIKNPNSQQTKAVKKIRAFNKIALTGTPIENKLLDYWSIFDFVNEGYLSTMSDFKNNYITPIEKYDDKEKLENLRTIAKPFVLRRHKTDEEIKNELPDKFTNDIYCGLSKKQEKLYNSIIDETFEKIPEKQSIKRRGIILKTITALKQICNHPSQFLKSESAKINESNKMELLINILENILNANEKVIIFTQYVKMAEIIEKLVSNKLKTDVLLLHGSQSVSKKKNIINDFQKNQNYPILVASLKTGGTGLNLTAANNVIHYDLWWNPAVENQATDRVYRIGQDRDVMVYRLITKGTLEEEIDAISKRKIDLAKKAISDDETFITELNNEELRKILSLRY